ncbi:FAD-dependent oxidoreductase [Corynebacterium sp. KPL3927]|uniref:FAD-dependent oxidoreductase n=1 Tax=Corynebacterium sp. KPL3927 TaxID=3158324 RepID=UPI0032EC073B
MRVDVVIIGGGFAGTSAAITLARARACQVVCVWGRIIGTCRSGRERPRPFG